MTMLPPPNQPTPPPPAPPAPPASKGGSATPWIVGGIVGVVFLLVVGGLAAILLLKGGDEPAAPINTPAAERSEGSGAIDGPAGVWERDFNRVWDGYTNTERSDFCDSVEYLGLNESAVTLAEETASDYGADTPSISEIEDVLVNKCASLGSSSAGEIGGGWQSDFDGNWAAAPYSTRKDICDGMDILGVGATTELFIEQFETSIGVAPPADEVSDWLIEKCATL
jgi:hypothetical protein